MTSAITTTEAFVVFPMGKKRFALSAEHVSELARQDTCQQFPHTTPLITGVVLRRNQLVPVMDVAPMLVGLNAPVRKFFLIVQKIQDGNKEQMAIPVSGECELAEAEPLPVNGKLPPHVAGLLSIQHETIEILDLKKLVGTEVLQ